MIFRRDSDPKPGLRLFETIGMKSAEVLDEGYLVFCSKTKMRAMAAVRLIGRPRVPGADVELRHGWEQSILLKLRDLFSGLQKRGIPLIYMVFLSPIDSGTEVIRSSVKQLELDITKIRSEEALNRELLREKKAELRRLLNGDKLGFFQTEVVFLLWADGSKGRLEEVVSTLERNVDSLLASLMSVFPEMEANKLQKGELVDFMRNFFCLTQLPA